MTKDDELEQLRAENSALVEALRRKDDALAQAQQAKQELHAGLKEAVLAIGLYQERVQVLEGLIAGLQERVTTLERQQAKDSHNSSLPPSSDRFVRPAKSLRTKSGKKAGDNQDIVGITCGQWRGPMRSSSMPSSAVSAASRICVSKSRPCQNAARCSICQPSGCGSRNIRWKKSRVRSVATGPARASLPL